MWVVLAVAAAAAAAQSSGSRGSPDPGRTHVYAETAQGKLRLSLRLPSGERPARGWPALMLLHQGGFSSGSRKSVNWCGAEPRRLVAYGFAVAVVDYRLCRVAGKTVATFPAQLDDALDALRWLRTADGIDPTRVGCGGCSAGGGLCALLASLGRVTAGVSIVGWTDWFVQDRQWRTGPRPIPSPGCASVPLCLVGGAELPKAWGTKTILGPSFEKVHPRAARRMRESSAILAANVSSAPSPLFLVGAERDECHPAGQARELAAAYRRRGVPHRYVEVPGAAHSCALMCTPKAGKISDQLHKWLQLMFH
eukprot:TRINITY_DN16477_c0_g1_i1.p1 TRINITY_DN16477_c0_g1~~TRINITY_DN16477_c0_g1_i1.p1  ORF type:complete len:324 (+),score=97.89 TRINITY_DN16477_c0_g1_i1:47-973(+)